ncbi:NADPH--cytochrome P450 reductase-like protein [Lepidopterella palustris CBS 459.81]|uniref:Bifunctional cytochrome P450/NADPH--P450 reductase n=1 Tax=Lepidopterella palustris CBS 459.81 TaxID=1314670 RepID=A0A8E2EKX7_9PEZI|nr:NADPH--cytochrome P450 reductase-like protein [Lepidopterella palustris CBS 459.81]
MVKTIPSPPALPFIGNLLDIKDDVPTRALERLADKYGGIFKVSLRGQDRIVIASYDLFEELCDETRFCKITPPGLAALNRGGPSGLFSASHEKDPDWGQAHRILMPAFGPVPVRGMFDEMHDIANQLVLKWARKGSGYRIPVTDEFTRLTLDTIALCAMDFRFNSFYQDNMHPFVESMNRVLGAGASRARIPTVVQKFMWSANEQLKEDSQFMKNVSAELVQHRRENPTEKKDLLNAMINGKDPKTGEGMRDELIVANMITFLIAGHETTSGLLSFAFLNLLKNPETYFKAQQEVDNVVGKGKLTVDHLKDLKYINAVLRETLRLTPTAPAFARRVRDENKEDPPTLANGEYILDRGLSYLCLVSKIQKDPKVFGEDANDFRPERMLDGEFEKLPKCAWKPFGTGMRACIGRPFAWQEALLVTAILLQNFNFRLDDPSYEMQIKANLTIKPRDFYMRASLRSGITPTTLQQSLSTPMSGLKIADATNPAASETNEARQNGNMMTVLYGSNTGTCQALAQKVASDACRHGYHSSVADLDSAMDNLPKCQPVVIITASYEGQPTDNAAHFVAWLQSLKDGKSLEGVSFSVFGCGHSDWASTFQRIPKLIESALESHGATKYAAFGSADVSKGDMFSEFDTWADQVLWPSTISSFGVKFTPKAEAAAEPKVEMDISTKSRSSQLQQYVQHGTVVDAKALTAPGEPEKRHLEIKLPEGTEYEAGDYLAVLPLNPDESVRRVLSKYALPWDSVVTIKSGGPVNLPANTPMSAFDLLKGFVELSVPATKKNLQTCLKCTSDASTITSLTTLTGPSYHDLIVSKRISLLDILETHPQIALPFAEYLAMLPPMRSRHYSISSSPLHNPLTCTITYGVIDSASISGHGRFVGVAGSYLSSLRKGDQVQVSVRKSNKSFHLPASAQETPIMMFCAGTGLAPFRGFIQERATLVSAGRILAPAVLFIGCRAPTADRLYGPDLDAWAKLGAVDVRYAFSRDVDKSAGCKYVQDRMLHDKQDIFSLWERGAKVFLCGSPGMVEGVKGAARELIKVRARELGLQGTRDDLENWLKEMQNERVSIDVFA